MSKTKPAAVNARQLLHMGAIHELKKNEAVYTGGSDRFYMVVSGRVRMMRQDSEDTSPALIAFYLPDDFFGEAALLGHGQRITSESAYATEPTRVMTWEPEEILQTISQRHELAAALMQFFIARTIHLQGRVQTLCCDSVTKRIGRGVVDLARRMGSPVHERGRTVQVGHLSHQVLAQYVGVTREVVSIHMARFKASGDVDYERNGTIRLNPNALAAKLDRMQ